MAVDERSTADSRQGAALRFVVLQHDAPRGRHWDFMLEAGGVLRTWALAEAPGGPGPVAAEALPDHRLVYLDHEGPISGDRGTVTRWDEGTYRLDTDREGEVAVRLEGRRLRGRAVLSRPGEEGTGWEFRFMPAGE